MAAIAAAPDAQSQTLEVAGGGEVTLVSSADQRRSGIVVEGLPELADDQTYELWYIDDAGAASAGTVDVSGAETWRGTRRGGRGVGGHVRRVRSRDVAGARRDVHAGSGRRDHRRAGRRFTATHDGTDRRHRHVV